MQLKLEKLEIKNYGNLKNVELKKLGDLNIIIGPNNCGKTHVLKAIELLNGEVRGVESKDRYLKDYGRNPIEIKFKFRGFRGKDFVITLFEDRVSKTLSYKIDGLREISDEHERIRRAEEIADIIGKTRVLLCSEERLTTYKNKSLEDYIIENLPDDNINEIKNILSEIDPKIVDIVKHRSEYLKTFQIGRLYDASVLCTIDEQGSGIKSLICLIVDILAHKVYTDIILIDEPELGLHPSAKHWLLNWLLKLSKDHQIFITTHDPTFVNPLIFGERNVSVYLYSVVDETFKKIDFSKSFENPALFAGFLPHTSSLKEIHIYVEGTSDVYVFQALLQKYLQSVLPDRWFEIYNKIGIYHLGGSNYSPLLQTIPLTPRSVAIFDGNIKDQLKGHIKKLNDHKGSGKIFPEFKLCESLEELKEALKTNACPIYYLSVNDIAEIIGVRDKKPRVIGQVAWSKDLDEMPKAREIIEVLKIILSDYLKSKLKSKPKILADDGLTSELSLIGVDFKQISGDWKRTSEGLIQEILNTACNTVLITDFKLKNGIVEVEANSIDGVGGQHIVWRSDENRNNCYMFGSVNAGRQDLYAHFWIWKNGRSIKEIKFEISKLPKIEANKFHKYKIIFQDNKFEFYIDGRKIGEIRDDTIRDAGYVGLHCGSKTIFRNLKVWSLDG